MTITTMQAAQGITHATRDELIALRRILPRKLTAPLDRVHSVQAGAHVSMQRGRGMDYLESRAYQPGDDVRRLDWRLTARSGRLHTKVFQEDHERRLLVLLDDRDTMHFGTRRRFKSVQAARAAALAVWLAAATGMRVGLTSFGRQRLLVHPQTGSRGALAILHALTRESTRDPGPSPEPESLGQALRRIAPLVRGGTRTLLVTDGFGVDPEVRARLVALRRHARLGVLLVNDAIEIALPAPGSYPMAIDGQVAMVDLQSQVSRVRFRDALGHDSRALQHMLKTLGIPNRQVDTVVDPLAEVATLMDISLPGVRA